jgi:hypothetical protein
MKTLKTYYNLYEAANTSFQAIIDDTLTDEEKKVHGTYSIPKKSFKLKIHAKDKKTFVKLFKKAPDKTVGNGEISLYWLFGSSRAKETRGGTEPDLRIDKKAVEVKAYPKHDPISLGRFQDRRTFRAMLNTLFGISNLFQAFSKDNTKGNQSFKGELSFRYPDVLEAAEKFIELSTLFKNNKELMNFKIFKDMKKTVDDFEKSLKGLGYGSKINDAESIAVGLMKRLIDVSIGDKPGDKGYIANLKDSDPTDIWFHYIDFKNMKSDNKTLSAKGTFAINGGVFKASFSTLFPGK